MSSAHTHSQEVARLVPLIYEASIGEFGLHPNTDMSRSNKCHTLTKDMLLALRCEEIAVRRELHKDASGLWHYIIAHTDVETPPSDEDIITDINPWCFSGGEAYTGYLHAPRQEVMATLAAADLSAEQVSLRGLSTIVLAHTEDLLTSHTHPPIL